SLLNRQKVPGLYIDINIVEVNRYDALRCGRDAEEMQDTSGVHVWLVLAKAFRALAAHADGSLNLSQTGLGHSDFRVLEVLLHKGPLPVNTIGPKVWLSRDRSVLRSTGWRRKRL